MMNKLLSISLLAIFSAFFSLNVSAETAIIVNPGNGVGDLSDKDISAIFLGKKKKFPGGGTAVPVDQDDDSPLRDSFNQSVLGKNASQLKSYWAQRVFTGKGQPPKQVGSDADVKKLVAENPAMIGYIDAGAVDGSVKVVHKF
ncbi:MAG: phosphate ABC transporter substrate-binding protein [Pseudomonadales bacterium]|nr:phosphate ABC transporter substrate-binding protein [Pseudomonadales bacterium]